MALNASDYARLAEQYAADLSPEERTKREQNARQSNIKIEFEPEVTDMLFRSTATPETPESEHQPSTFGSAVFAFA